ncbi:MAG: zf-HC2 domain-containing protein [Oscillospiraceae bacterium]|nr:zf-HC2 domain-containing protein [Oscillospiraceae bacterium]
MTCEEFNQMLDDYENLTEEEKASLNEHAAQCESCSDELDFMLSVISQLNALPRIQPPPDFRDKLNERIRLENSSAGRIGGMLNSIRVNYRRYSTVAACLVLAVIVGLNGKTLRNRIMHTDTGGTEVGEVTEPVNESKPSETGEAAQSVESAEADNTEASTVEFVSVNTAKMDNSVSDVGFNTAKEDSKNSDTVFNTPKTNSVASSLTENRSAVSDTPFNTASIDVPTVTVDSTASVGRSTEQITAETETADSADETSVVIQQIEDGITVAQAKSRSTLTEEDYGTAEMSLEEEDTSSEPYTIARGIYRLPDVEIARAEVKASVRTEIGYDFVDNKEEDTSNIALGRYYIISDDGYISIDNNKIEVNGADAQRAVELIQQYTDSEDDSYYVINSDNIPPMLEHMEREGINYQNNVESAEEARIGFKLVIE